MKNLVNSEALDISLNYDKTSPYFAAQEQLKGYLKGIPTRFADRTPFPVSASISKKPNEALVARLRFHPKDSTFPFHLEKEAERLVYAEISVPLDFPEYAYLPSYTQLQAHFLVLTYFYHYRQQFFAAKNAKSKKRHEQESTVLWSKYFVRTCAQKELNTLEMTTILQILLASETDTNTEFFQQFARFVAQLEELLV